MMMPITRTMPPQQQQYMSQYQQNFAMGGMHQPGYGMPQQHMNPYMGGRQMGGMAGMTQQ